MVEHVTTAEELRSLEERVRDTADEYNRAVTDRNVAVRRAVKEENRSQTWVADALGVSGGRVWQIIRRPGQTAP